MGHVGVVSGAASRDLGYSARMLGVSTGTWQSFKRHLPQYRTEKKSSACFEMHTQLSQTGNASARWEETLSRNRRITPATSKITIGVILAI